MTLILTELYNNIKISWKITIIPVCRSKAKVNSLFKKEDKYNPPNYRGITLLDTTYEIYTLPNNRLKTIAKGLLKERGRTTLSQEKKSTIDIHNTTNNIRRENFRQREWMLRMQYHGGKAISNTFNLNNIKFIINSTIIKIDGKLRK